MSHLLPQPGTSYTTVWFYMYIAYLVWYSHGYACLTLLYVRDLLWYCGTLTIRVVYAIVIPIDAHSRASDRIYNNQLGYC